jgi:carbamoyl-phosphate synthase small subunit
MALDQVDTRALTKVLRNSGTMKGIIALEEFSEGYIKEKLQAFSNSEAVLNVTTKERYTIRGTGKHVAIMDFGIKANIIRSFKQRNCKMTIFPATASYKEILEIDPDLIFLSNGPGDPEDLSEVIENLKQLIGKKPIVGICLGHQLLALALGGKTAKLKFGHRGCNHPVKDIEENRVYITSQNHGYYVNELPEDTMATHISLNDGTVEGMRHKTLPIYSVQFHPEACPGPRDANSIFNKFLAIHI